MDPEREKLYTDLIDAAMALFHHGINDLDPTTKTKLVYALDGETEVAITVTLPKQNVACALHRDGETVPLFAVACADEDQELVH